MRWSPRARWRRRHIHRPASRFVRRRQRHAAFLQAWELTRAIVEDRPDPVAHLAAGVILQPGEDPWTRARARLAVRTGHAASTAYTQLSWPGRRAKNVTCDTITEQWRNYREIEWLITSKRVVGRPPVSSEMISAWWSGLAGVDIDLASDRIVFDGVNEWTGMLTGPAVAPVAVAAIGYVPRIRGASCTPCARRAMEARSHAAALGSTLEASRSRRDDCPVASTKANGTRV